MISVKYVRGGDALTYLMPMYGPLHCYEIVVKIDKQDYHVITYWRGKNICVHVDSVGDWDFSSTDHMRWNSMIHKSFRRKKLGNYLEGLAQISREIGQDSLSHICKYLWALIRTDPTDYGYEIMIAR